MASYGQQAKDGFVWGLLGRGGSIVVATGTSVILARLLTPHDFGVVATAMFFIQIAQRLANMGFNTALMRLPNLREDHSATVFTINVLFGVVGGLALALSSPWLAAFYRSEDAGRVVPLAGLAFGLGCLAVVPSALLARRLRFKTLTLIEAIYYTIVSVLSIWMAWLGMGYWSLIYAFVLATLLDVFVKFGFARWRPSIAMSRQAFMELWSFGAGLHLKRLLESVALNIDNLVIGRILGVTMLGFYDKSFTTMNRAVALVSSAGQTVSVSVLGRIQEDAERFRQGFRKVTLGVSLVGYSTFAALAALGMPLFLVMFGSQWTAAVAPFQVLCAAGLLKLYIAYVSAAVQAKGRVWGEVWRQAVYAGLIVVGVIVGSRWGLTGAAFGVLAATVIMTVLMCDLLLRVTTMTSADIVVPQLAGLSCAVVVAVAITVARLLLWTVSGDPPVFAQLLVEAGAGGLAGSLFLLFCPFREGRELVRETLFDFAPFIGRKLRLTAT
jgi:O-antigen/teichoic acid export membrane protein